MEKNFYETLGKLFYAFAAADKVVRPEEVERLKMLVRKEWLSVDDLEDEFGTDAAYQIESVFDWMVEQSPDARDCFEEFKLYKEQNETLFSTIVKQKIFKTADAIASSFAGKNKAELILLSKLSVLLKA